MNKKEMGITVKGLFEYAEICLDGEMYQELNSALNIVFDIANAWGLNEIEEIQDSCEAYRNRAKVQIKEASLYRTWSNKSI